MPPNTKLKALVKMAKHRWIIERDYEELKQELGWGTMKDGTGADFTITPHFASPRMGSWWPSGTVFPPPPAPVILDFRAPTSAGLPPAWIAAFAPSGIIPNSIATLRTMLARQLLGQLPHCPFCGSRSG